MSALGRHGAPKVAGELAAERLMRSLDYRLAPEARRLTQREVAIVMHALADHTAIMAALEYARDESCPWPEARSLGRWFHAVGDELERLARDVPPAEHRLVGTGCVCGKWKAGLGESITRGFDLHLLDRRCDWCGEPIPTTKRVDAETCSDRCAKDRQRARVVPPGGPDA